MRANRIHSQSSHSAALVRFVPANEDFFRANGLSLFAALSGKKVWDAAFYGSGLFYLCVEC